MSHQLMDSAAGLKGLKPFERCVLMNLAWRANHKSHLSWPSIETIAADTGVSERQVYRALKSLRAKGLIHAKGKTKYGTVRYLVTLAPPQGNGSTHQLADGTCHVGSEHLPMGHPNTVSEPSNGTGNIYTSPEQLGLSHPPPPPPAKQTDKPQPTSTTPVIQQANISVPANVSGIQGKAIDSKVVKAWKAAHAAIGLPCIVDGITGAKLGSLSKGPGALPYESILNIVIPNAVRDWTRMCQYISGLLHLLKPPPTIPNAGFILQYRQFAYKFCNWDEETRAWAVKAYHVPHHDSSTQCECADPLEYE